MADRVPDLLFEDEQEARLKDLGALVDAPELVSASTPLHRLTVFLTYRCNLACPYCKTVGLRRAGFDEAGFAALLEQQRGTEVRHLHFTGGEASLLPSLPALVRRAKAAGVAQVSLTSNGTLPPARYLELVRAGLDELRVSLDAADPTLGALLTGRPRAWGQAMDTVRALGQARREGERFCLIVNTVVGPANRRELPGLVRALTALGVDDLKLITDVDARDSLADFPEHAQVRAALDELLAKAPGERWPLLRRKVRTVFARDAIGLEHVSGEDWRCYVPLTERTVDATSYYPCSVYLREGGAPLGPLTDSPEEQRAKSARFVREGRCLEDALCRRYCLHCTRTWNERVAAARLGAWLRRFDLGSERLVPGGEGARLYVTPLGLPHRARFREALARLGLRPHDELRVRWWSRLSTVLQVRGRDARALERAARFEHLWRERCPEDEAEVWSFPRAAHHTLVAHKRTLRAGLDVRCDVPGLPRAVSLHALHVDDVMPG